MHTANVLLLFAALGVTGSLAHVTGSFVVLDPSYMNPTTVRYLNGPWNGFPSLLFGSPKRGEKVWSLVGVDGGFSWLR
jgi:hypothetical protein